MRARMRRAQFGEGLGEQIEPLDAMHAAEEQHHERVGGNAETRAKAALAAFAASRRSTPFGMTAIGASEAEVAERAGFLFGGRVQQRRAASGSGDRAARRRGLAPPADLRRLRLQHAPRRDHVRHAGARAPGATPTTRARSRRRGRGRDRRATAPRSAARGRARRRTAAETIARHSAPARPGRRRRRAATPAGCRVHSQSSSRPRRRRRRAAVPGTGRAPTRVVRRTEAPAENRP